MRTLRLGTRRSVMATTQAQGVADRITEQTGHPVELVPITSYGDVTRAHLTQLGGTGVFVSALRDRLLAKEIDLAVHSLKDLPTAEEPGLTIAAVPPRDAPQDALCARDGLTFAELPSGARVGTGSPRRVAQLAERRADLSYVPIRGNAETRLGKVADGEVDAVVLARAGLYRVGRSADITEVFGVDRLLPAPGQGALAVECRSDDELAELLKAVDDPRTRACVTAERVVLAVLEAGCAAPVGAFAEPTGAGMWLRAAAVAPDGSQAVRRDVAEEGGDVVRAAAVGRALAAQMIAAGADAIVSDSRTVQAGDGAEARRGE